MLQAQPAVKRLGLSQVSLPNLFLMGSPHGITGLASIFKIVSIFKKTLLQ